MKADTHVWTAHNGPSNETPQRRLPPPRHSGLHGAGDEHVHDPRQARLKAALLSPGTPLAGREAGVVPRVEATRISRSISPSHLYLSISRQLDYPEIIIPAHESSEG